MSLLLLGLAGGAGLIISGCWLLMRFARLGAWSAAGVAALAALGLYLPAAILNWPGGDVLAIHLAVYLLAAYGCGVVLGPWARPTPDAAKPRLHWGPALLIGFFMGLIALNGVFILLAERGLSPRLGGELFGDDGGVVSSAFPGVVSHDFQQKEQLYSEYLRQVQRQRERGWQIRKGWVSTPVAGQPAQFRVAARTRDGEPLVGATVQGAFLRPADSRLDQRFELPEIEPGVYQGTLVLPAAGRWDLVLELHKGDDWHEIRASTSLAVPAS